MLDILVQSRRDAKAAKRFTARLMKKQCRVPRALVTDKLRSFGVAPHLALCRCTRRVVATGEPGHWRGSIHGRARHLPLVIC
ncbi:DDE-type integrase/transposase/recombinase, partial [Streptomyces sp. NPDC059441]|uniref:DDE-type integrase/transposase/recombinase n=1 Tax=Streptomyces sp. NPDC059441 TaxID=3346829 RepID=UPI00368CF2BE